ncbi:MAG: FAD-dependent oxidoreductase [Myxococcota bacterium]
MSEAPLAPADAPTVLIVGGGAAGLLTAYRLLGRRRIVLLEAAPRLGGAVEARAQDGHHVDVGARFFSRGTHPTFAAFVDALGLPIGPEPIDVTLHDVRRGGSVVLPPSTPAQVGAIARRPARARQLLRFRKLMSEVEDLVAGEDWGPTLRELQRRLGWTSDFHERLLAPWAGASLGAHNHELAELAAYPIMRHFLEHQPEGAARPVWAKLPGGVGAVAGAIATRLAGREDVTVRTGAAVQAIFREGAGWRVRHEAGEATGEAVVVALPAEVAAPLLPAELGSRLAPFRYGDVDVVVHGDPSWMPKKRADWSLYTVLDRGDHGVATVWEGRERRADLFMSWCPAGARPGRVLHVRRHRVWRPTPDCGPAQKALAERQGAEGLFLAGSYTAGIDTLESAARSAEAVSAAL